MHDEGEVENGQVRSVQIWLFSLGKCKYHEHIPERYEHDRLASGASDTIGTAATSA